ncbi:MAG: universal stress protein [Gammaproteobacteria bacterium]|nr:universal stress protein [Gammaproteobacteria bacterium]
MNKIQRILVVVDSENDSLSRGGELPIELAKAVRLVTDKSSTELHLFSVAYQKHLHHDSLSWDFNQSQKRQEYCDQLAKNLDQLATKLKSEGYQVSSESTWAYPRYEAIINKANEISADLIVQHTRSYGKLEFHHLTNDSWQMVRHCSIPLLLVKNDPWNDQPALLAAVDPMHSHHKPLALDNRILEAALTLQERLTGKLHVVHGYAEAARPFAPAGVIEKEHREVLDELLSSYAIQPEQLHFLDETPVSALQQEAHKLKTDILIMGAISRSRLSEMLIGSTAEKVLDFFRTDVLIIKPKQA